MKVKLQSILTLRHLYHVHNKINIPSLSNEYQRPRQHHITVTSLLSKKDAVICVSVQVCKYGVLCHTQIFDSEWVVFAKNFIHEEVRVMVVIAVDYPILCGPCMNINILLFSGNKNNIITCHPLFVLDCRWCHRHYDRCIHMNN